MVDFIANGKETAWVRINSRFEFQVGHSDFQGHFSEFDLIFFIKGQKISEGNCTVLNFPKKNKVIRRISTLASMMSQKEIKADYLVIGYHLI